MGDVNALETNTGVDAPEINALESNTLTDGNVSHNEGGPRRLCQLRRLRQLCQLRRLSWLRWPASDGTR